MKLRLYRCYESDHRTSMDVYARSLSKCATSKGIEVEEFVPRSRLEKYRNSRFVMRYLRYMHYAFEVKRASASDSDIEHVIDHGYAHLFPALSSNGRVVSVHDLIPYLTWKGEISGDETNQRESKPALNLHSLKYLERYDKIIAVSQNTAKDLSRYLSIPSSSIAVVPPVLDDKFYPMSTTQVAAFQEKYRLDRNTKWIMVSGREHYKNHVTALRVLARLKQEADSGVAMIKTGLPSPEFDQQVSTLRLQDSVRYLYLEDHDELPLLYNSIDVLFFPSLYEGFGMPVTEAIACGTPVVCSNRASLPEVGGELALQCDALDEAAFVQALYKVLTDRHYALRFRRHGPDWVRQFRTDVVGRKLHDVYQSVIVEQPFVDSIEQ